MGKITATDRFIFTLLFSIIVYLTILLGVSFDASPPPTNQPVTNLKITLVKQQTKLAPKDADFLAQANNEGGGESDKKVPEPVLDTPILKTKDDLSSQAAPTPPRPKQPTPEPVENPVTEVEPIKAIEKPPAKQEKVITQAKAERKIITTVEDNEKVDNATESPKPKLSARDLIFQAKNEVARLEEKLDASTKVLGKKPKTRRLSSRTKEFAAAAYHEAWRKKVERIGNFNYPLEAKRKRINGSLMLSVDINPDGSVPVDGIVISRSSGHKVLDDAAIKIVRLAAPYAAIPDNVLKDFDMITIIRTWKFETGKGLQAR